MQKQVIGGSHTRYQRHIFLNNAENMLLNSIFAVYQFFSHFADPKLPTSVRNNNMTWNDYVPNAENSIPEAVASGGAACRCGQYLNGQQASGGPQYCVCPSTTYNSCCYDRLHDGTFRRGAMQCNKLICNKCKLQKLPVRAGCQKRVASHHYETLGPFLDQEDDQENAPAIRVRMVVV